MPTHTPRNGNAVATHAAIHRLAIPSIVESPFMHARKCADPGQNDPVGLGHHIGIGGDDDIAAPAATSALCTERRLPAP
jgi:hypothetical protein